MQTKLDLKLAQMNCTKADEVTESRASKLSKVRTRSITKIDAPTTNYSPFACLMQDVVPSGRMSSE